MSTTYVPGATAEHAHAAQGGQASDEPAGDPAAVARYLALDFSPTSEAARDLMARVVREDGRAAIDLQDIAGPLPADITMQMGSWYQTYVHPLRVPALQAICQRYEAATDQSDAVAFLPQARQSKLDEELLKAKRDLYNNMVARFRSKNEEIRDKKKKLVEAEREYRSRRMELGGRDAKPLRKVRYYSFLILLLFSSEAAINLDAFKSLPWATPAIAWGSMVIIGLGVGFAADVHGKLLRQFEYWFGGEHKGGKHVPAWRKLLLPDSIVGKTLSYVHYSPARRGPAWRQFLLADILLTGSLSYVYYARDAYFSEQVPLSQYGQHGESFVWIVGGSLLGNLLVYVIGTIWAFWMHDPDPDFVDRWLRVQHLEHRIASLSMEVEETVEGERQILVVAHKTHSEECARAEREMAIWPSLRRPRELYQRFTSQDMAVAGLLTGYRTQLISNIRDRGTEPKVNAHVPDHENEIHEIKVAELRPIVLKLFD